jgi:carbon starvation protein CstA
MGWATFWAIFSQTNQVTLAVAVQVFTIRLKSHRCATVPEAAVPVKV